MTTQPGLADRKPSLASRLVKRALLAFYRSRGWTAQGTPPADRRFVLIAAPHTSNWDGINMLATAGFYRVSLKWMGKQELTAGPLGGIVRWLGCVPVDRKGGTDLVAQMAAAFAAVPRMVLAIPPEGTRAAVNEWKTGFYHIALAAGAPLVISVLDYGTRTIRISGSLVPSGDYTADLALIKSHYDGATGLRGGKFLLERGSGDPS